MNPIHLVRLAEETLRIGGGTPNQVMINRAISTAYYALFHAICWDIVDHTVGRKRSRLVVTPIYRAMQHGTARTVFEGVARDAASPEPLKQVSRTFLELQEARISADYDPGSRHARREALDLIRRAEDAITMLQTSSGEDRAILAVKLITRQR